MKIQQVKNIIENYIENEQSYIDEHEEIIEILKPLEGKPINGQVLNKKRLGEKFRFCVKYGMYYIIGKHEHLIEYANSNESIIQIEPSSISRGFKYFDACNGEAARKRIEQVKNLDLNKVVNIFSNIEKCFNEIRFLFNDIDKEKLGSLHNPIYYDLLDIIYKNDNNHGIKLSDFYFIRKERP